MTCGATTHRLWLILNFPPKTTSNPPRAHLRAQKQVIKIPEATNVVGRKRAKKDQVQTFLQLSRSDRERTILQWCVGERVAQNTIETGDQIQMDDLDMSQIDPAVFNGSHVCISQCQIC